MTPHRRTSPLLVAALLVPALLLSGCGGQAKAKPSSPPSADLPKGNVKVPPGVTLTKAGASLGFREPAVVAYAPNPVRSSVLSMSVDSVQQGSLSDFGAYQLDEATKKSRAYYVHVSVKNLGTGDLSHAAVPLFAVDSRNVLIQQSTFNNTFAKCPSLPLPAGFVQGKAVQECLVYLVPEGGTIVAISYRPLQAFEPITWKGTITPVTLVKKPGAKAKKGTKKG